VGDLSVRREEERPAEDHESGSSSNGRETIALASCRDDAQADAAWFLEGTDEPGGWRRATPSRTLLYPGRDQAGQHGPSLGIG
jgi:hypothetical protein